MFEDQATDNITHSHAGVLIAGGAFVPLDPSYPDARIELIAGDADLKVLLVKDEDGFAEHRNIVKCPVLSVMNILDDEFLLETSAVDWHPPVPNTSYYIIYTSGTTGKPKGVVLEHANLIWVLQVGPLHTSMGLGPGSRFLLSAHMIYQVSCVTQFPALSVSATLVLAPKSALLDELQLLINTAKVS